MRELHFSITGEFITTCAREMLYYENNLSGALDLLKNCLVRDDLTPETIDGIALSILNGDKEIRGTYPGDDYGVYSTETKPERTLETWGNNLKQKLNEAEDATRRLSDKLCCIANFVPDYLTKDIDRDWEANYCDPEDTDRSIFGTNGTLSTKADLSPELSGILNDVIDRLSSPDDAGPDYGWLMADGTFYPVDWGNHNGFAYDYCQEHFPEWYTELPQYDPEKNEHLPSLFHDRAGDYLTEKKHAILLHNPSLGTAIVTASHEPTKAQKEFLFDYYTKRNKRELASRLYDTE